MLLQLIFNLAGVEGIEPSYSVLETDVLPLNYTPIIWWATAGFERCDKVYDCSMHLPHTVTLLLLEHAFVISQSCITNIRYIPHTHYNDLPLSGSVGYLLLLLATSGASRIHKHFCLPHFYRPTDS